MTDKDQRLNRQNDTNDSQLPLTAQERRLLDPFYMPVRDYCFISTLAQLPSDTDFSQLCMAIAAVLNRHEAFRFRYPTDSKARLKTKVATEQFFDESTIERFDLCELPESEKATAILDFGMKLKKQICIATGPLCAFGYIELGNSNKFILMIVHHIISDAFSEAVLLTEIAQEYRTPGYLATKPLATTAGQWSEFMATTFVSIDPKFADLERRTQDNSSSSNRCSSADLTFAKRLRCHFTYPGIAKSFATLGYSLQSESMILTALTQAMADTSRDAQVRVNHISHGRNAIRGLNIRDTVAYIAPLRPINLEAKSKPHETLAFVNRALSATRPKAFDWIYERFAASNADVMGHLGEITFNSFGHGAESITKATRGFFQINNGYFLGPDQHPDNKPLSPTVVKAEFVVDDLEVTWMYDPRYTSSNEIYSREQAFAFCLASLCQNP